MRKKQKTYALTSVMAAQRRVLRLLDSYLAAENQRALVATDRGGLFTRAELRLHIKSALALKVRP